MDANTFNELLTLALQAVALVLTLVVTFAADILKRKWGVDVEARHRDALKEAIRSGASAIIENLTAADLDPVTGVTIDDLARRAKDDVESYVKRSVPDAIAALSPLPDVLDRQIIGVLGGLLDARRSGR